MMATNLKVMKDRLPASRRKKVEARAQELIAEQMTLRDLRKARSQTQRSMAKKLKVGQDSISRLEQRSNLLLSTLQAYISAMGGSLELVVRFPDRPDVTLAGLLDSRPENASSPRKATPKHGRESTLRETV